MKSLAAVAAPGTLLLALLTRGQGEAPKPGEPLKLAPRAYFVGHCQRCHGVDGANYPKDFAKAEGKDKLRADIVRMAAGPGGAPLKDPDVDVQMAYHALISDRRPFLSVTERKGAVVKGEVSDGATLKASIGTVEIDDDDEWTLTLPSDTDFAKVKLTATLGDKTTDLVPAESAYAKPDVEKP